MRDLTQLPRGTERRGKESPPDARWMTDAEIRAELPYRSGSILLGQHNGERVGVDDDRHILTVAGSRAGKSSTCLKPNLALWPSSVLCIDPKGELAMETAEIRAAMGQDVHILDPFGEVKGSAARFRKSYDPLNEIKAGRPADIIDNAALIADALIVPDKGNTADHWSLSAKNLLRGLILLALYRDMEYGLTASLSQVREWVTAPSGDDDSEEDGKTIWLSTLFNIMSKADAFDGVMAGVGTTMKGKPRNERGSIISTAVEQISFLDSPAMRDHLSSPDLATLRILKRKPTTIYLVLPASRMATHFRWLRVILTLALAALENEPDGLGDKGAVLFVLEEFPQLGYMRQIEAAAGLMAGYKVKLWTVLQDLSQLKSAYPQSWETFIGNTGVLQAFGNTDATTIEYISGMLGTRQMTQTQANYNTPSGVISGGKPTSESHHMTPLLAPFEVSLHGERDTGMQFIKRAGLPPAFISRLSHKDVRNVG